MRRITDAKQTGSVPLLEPVDLDREKLDLFPILQLIYASLKVGCELQDSGAERIESAPLDFVKSALANDHPGLKVVAAVNQDECLSEINSSEHLFRIVRPAADAEPEHVVRNAEILELELPCLPHDRMPAIAANDQFRANPHRGVSVPARSHSDDAFIVVQQIDGLVPHAQIECRESSGLR